MEIKLDRLKDAALYAVCVTLGVLLLTAGAWWYVPGKIVFCTAVICDATMTMVIYAVLYMIERVLIKAAEIKRAARRGYVPRDAVCEIARMCER